MELLIPDTLQVSIYLVGGFLVVCAGMMWAGGRAYSHILSKINHLGEAFDDMKVRNRAADDKTVQVEKKQAGLEMTVAVMAEQMRGVSQSQERMETCLTEIARELRARSK